jgi:hypothetical protein
MKKTLKLILVSVLAIIVTGLWLTALFHISNLWRGDSDNAFLAIAGNSILKGNFLLHGYYLPSLDPYYPVDLYLNALAVKILGFRPILIHIIPVFIFLVLIAIAIIYVKDANGNRSKENNLPLKIGIFMVFVFLSMSVKSFAFFMLQEMHGSAIVLSLISILLFNRFLRKASGGFLDLFFGFSVLTVALINDNLAIIICAVPILTILALFFYTDFKSGTKKSRYLTAAFTVIAAVIFQKIILYAIRVSGGFKLAAGLQVAFIRLKYLPKNIYFYFEGLLRLHDANFFGKELLSGFTFIIMAKFVIIGILLTYIAVKITGRIERRLKDKDANENNFNDFVDFTLLSGTVFLTCAFLLSDIAIDKASARYLTPIVVYGLILAFRNIPGMISKYYDRLAFKIISAVIITIYASSFIYASLTPIPKSPERALGKWLLKRHLTYGYGSYWDSHVITLMTDGRVKVRPVFAPFGRLMQYKWLSKRGWYRKKGFFVIYSKNFIYGGVGKDSVIETFGKPSAVYTEDFQGTIGRAYGLSAGKNSTPPYVIMVYKGGIRIDGKHRKHSSKHKTIR